MLKHNVQNVFCRKCQAYINAKHPCISGRGNLDSKILILVEEPGASEDAEGLVFVGRSGALLQHHIDSLGMSCFIANSVRCRFSDEKGNTKAPTPTIIECCKSFTIDLIRRMQPKVVLAIGKVPMQQLLKINLNMEVARGKAFYHPILNTTIIPTYHPSFLLRKNDRRFSNEFASDLFLAKELSLKPPVRRIESKPKSLKDVVEIESYLIELFKAPSFSFDLETTGLNPHKDRITDISLCSTIGQAVHIPWGCFTDNVNLLNLLRTIFVNNSEKVAHNADFDCRFLKASCIDVKGSIFDTMIAYHTITMSYEGGQAASLYKLKTMAWLMTQEGGYNTILDKFGGIKGIQQKQKDTLPKKEQPNLFDDRTLQTVAGYDVDMNERLIECSLFIETFLENKIKELKLDPKEYYAAMDADVTYRIYRYLKLKIDELYSYPFYEISMPLCKSLIQIHNTGIKIDIPYIDTLIVENTEKAEHIRKNFMKKAGYEFNLNSTEMLSDFIHNKLKVPVNQKMMTVKGNKPSTDEEALLYYSQQRPILKHVLEYRSNIKQTSTYLSSYKELSDELHRVYPKYNQIGTATIRLSATNPNLQNVPRDNRIRNMVIPAEGCKLILCDLSQIELRILAMLSNDEKMIQAFESGLDFHAYTACVMFDIPFDSFDKKNNKDHAEKRDGAKIINFGIAYGKTAETLAMDLNIHIDKAKGFMHRFFTGYPKVAEWIKYTKSFAYQHGYVETLYGRRRYLPNIYSSDRPTKEGAERQCVNTCVQSPAGDICFMGINRVQDWINSYKKVSQVVGTVHDSLLVESPYNEVDEVAEIIPMLMTKDIPRVTIKLEADVAILDKWVK